MRFGFIVILLNLMFNLKGQSINVQTLIEVMFRDSSYTFKGEDIYLVKNPSDSFFNYNGIDPMSVSLIICNSQDDLLKHLRKRKEIFVLTFHKTFSDKRDDNEMEYIFSLNIAHLKGNRKKLNLLIHQDSYQVVFRKNAQNKNWGISKIKYPLRLDAIRNR